jgi:pyruvate/2-oxoglutarate dehydrogenase complex dihydrolipoamide dehydrogenase (E3) component/uncharacterized membrane protein YdjX (TVP38/TMEM64 family)
MSRTAARLSIVALIAAVLVIVVSSGFIDWLSIEQLKAAQTGMRSWVMSHPWQAAGGFFLGYIAFTSLSLPGATVLTLAAGALFGLARGTLLVSFASSIGATLAFLVSRFLLRDTLQSHCGERLRTFNEGVERDGAFYLFTLRLVPAFPFVVINLLAGLTPMRTGTFYWVSQLGMLPGTIAYVYAGTQLARIDDVRDVLSPELLGALALLGLLPLAMRLMIRLLQRRRIYRGFTRPFRFDFNLIVIGAGSAGLVSTYIGATARAKVALIERDRMGGDCLNTGCVPSKALLRTARLAADARSAGRFGIRRAELDIDFAQVMERIHSIIRQIEPHDSVERYESLGATVIRGEAYVVSPWEVDVDGTRYSARSIILATGARPFVPPIEGIDEVPYLTSETLWELTALPDRLVVLGGGPVGCELSQAFARLGSRVTQIERGDRLLSKEDADAASIVAEALRSDGVELLLETEAARVESTASGGRLVCKRADEEFAVPFDRLLVAVGRKANVEGLGLEDLGVQISPRGTVDSDAFQRTNFPNILVAGDVAGPYQFTHVAAHQAWYASINALIAPFWRFRTDYRVIPWATFTDPEVARVGLSEDDAQDKGVEFVVTRYELDDLDRAIADSAARGYVKVLTPPGKDRILGATIVGEHASEMLAEFVLAMKHGIGLNKLLGTIHVYPTFNEANKYVAGQWKRAHAPERLLRLSEKLMAWRRR